MNYSDYKFTLDVQLHQAQISVPATLNDTARRLCIGFTDGRKPYTIADGCQATFVAKKPDGLGLFNACTIENNTVIYEFTPNTTNVIGTYECEIRLYTADGLQLTSPSFLIVVDEGVVSDSDIIDSEAEATMLNQLITSEAARVLNENGRISNENARAIAEATRQSDFNDMLQSANSAIEAANEAAEKANNTELGEIDEALDAIIDIQENLIGLIAFTLDDVRYTAVRGMDWETWIKSRHNVGNVLYLDESDVVCVTGTDRYVLLSGGSIQTAGNGIEDGGEYYS